MNETKHIEQHLGQNKLEWLEPSFELLHEPESGSYFSIETDGIGPS